MPRGESSGDSEYCSASSSVNFPGDWQDGGAAGAGAGTSRISWVSVGDPERNHGTSVEPGSDSGAGGAAFRELKPGTDERSYYSLKLGASLQSSRRDRYVGCSLLGVGWRLSVKLVLLRYSVRDVGSASFVLRGDSSRLPCTEYLGKYAVHVHRSHQGSALLVHAFGRWCPRCRGMRS